MDKREVIKNYIQDNYQCYPGYYVWKKWYFIEYSWIHYTCENVLYHLALLPDDTFLDSVLFELKYDAQYCLNHAKSIKAKIIFETEVRILQELEALI